MAALTASILLSLGATGAVNHTLSYLPFSWDTIPRYTFCSNSSADYVSEGYGGLGLYDEASLSYVGEAVTRRRPQVEV